MATINYTAEKLNFKIHRGDSFNHTFIFDWDISAATITAFIVDENEQQVEELNVSDIIDMDGEWQFHISLTEQQTNHLGAYNWYMVMKETGEKTELNGEFSFIKRPYEN